MEYLTDPSVIRLLILIFQKIIKHTFLVIEDGKHVINKSYQKSIISLKVKPFRFRCRKYGR